MIGWPVEHSRSPTIHNAAAAECGVDLAYVAFPVAPGDGATAAESGRTLGLRGLSVTMPHKEDVIAALDQLSPAAELLGAVNCIVNDEGRLVGHNTDGSGFVRGFEHDTGLKLAGRSVLVVGAGGAARSIICACAAAGAADVIVVNRTAQRAEEAAELAGAVGRVGSAADVAHADVIVNATSLGMDDTSNRGLLAIDLAGARPGAVVIDIVYRPEITPLRSAATELGLEHHGGLSMLTGQAIEQFELWTGKTPSFEALRSVLA
ncbi:MAG: shikimate dehydrogenase [Acidimicrobiales bacterium]